MYLTDSYKKCNPGFEYASHLNPRRMLTKPSKPAGNGGHDNENQELIISVNDVLRADGGGGSEFEVGDTLGSGTFGQVVRCREKGTGRQAAVKVIKNHPAYFHQAHVEIGILHMLNTKCDESDQHHIVRMLDHFVHRSHLCIVFEVLNVNLYELLRQNNFRGLSTKLVRTFTRQLLVALRMLRNANVIHCDLKPENILVKSLETGRSSSSISAARASRTAPCTSTSRVDSTAPLRLFWVHPTACPSTCGAWAASSRSSFSVSRCSPAPPSTTF